ncbi:lytic transglycosylase domain-containing protein [Fulvimarina sp. 2208YS6-2-32]|uniref:Lytic transglycosylase domain-containing protein n=1 Tax=Fulvimarina uroteuthidis TaxID=3098149 RepID=A0ABU5I6V5_9HYPH|nr:lytic transglycosylase domain-containing protein [Fulvimarina sp. 2208YS6-2-32]MDY8110936.1 lytic transglycosylase domain-containing protein [Fulvimarina sp. 2208YS6-2-32]
MVFSMRGDGALRAQTHQAAFSKTYGDASREDRSGLFIFGESDEDDGADGGANEASVNPSSGDRASMSPRSAIAAAPTPPAAILAAIDDTAIRYGSHPALRSAGLTVSDWRRVFRANIEIESAYDPTATSSVGALGLGQLMPETAADLGVDPADVVQNLDGSARYLLAMLNRFGDEELAVAAYNAGPEAVARHGGIPPFEETRNHVVRVMAVAERLAGETR